MLDPVPLAKTVHGKSFSAALLGTAAFWIWPDQGDHAGWFAAAYGLALVAGINAVSAAKAAVQLRAHRRLRKRAMAAAQEHNPARWATDKELEEAGMFEPNGRPLGENLSGIPIFEPSSSVHSKIVAPPGSWKTIAAIVAAIMHLAHSARGKGQRSPSLIISDVKGELAAMCAIALKKLGFEVWILNETGHLGLGSENLNPYALLIDLYHSDDPARRARTGVIARALSMTEYPDPKDGDEKNRFWRAGSRDCLSAGKFMLLGKGDLTPANLWALLSDPIAFVKGLERLAGLDEMKHPGVLLARSLLETFTEEPQHFADFRSSAAQKLESFERPGMLEDVGRGANLNHSDIRKRQIIVFMVAPLAYADEMALLQRLNMQSFMLSLKEDVDGQPVEFILDEACNAKAALSNLIDDLTTIRGLGGRVHLVAHAESQIVSTWGRDAAKTLDAVTGLKQIMGTNSPEEARALSQALSTGMIESEELSFSTKTEDVGVRADKTGRPLMTPDEILSMPIGMQIILANGLRPILARKLSYARYDPICHLVGENPIEGGKLLPDPKVFLNYPSKTSPQAQEVVTGKGTDRHRIALARRSGSRMQSIQWRHGLAAPLRLLASIKGLVVAGMVLGGGYAATQSFGLPAMLVSYDYQGSGLAPSRSMTACQYLSPFGLHERGARSGSCAWIVLARGGQR